MYRLTVILLIICLLPAAALAAGYRIPENSFRSSAQLGACVAGADGADASYFNPGAMMNLDSKAAWETGALLIKLPEVKYAGTATAVAATGDSRTESFIVPYFHYVAPWHGERLRFGLSIVSPAGLTKRWDTPVARAFAEEYSLQVIEVNPTAAWRLNKRWTMGAGLRLLKSDGKIKVTPAATTSMSLEGDSQDTGYNLALHGQLNDRTSLGLTWRSRVTLGMKGSSVVRHPLLGLVNSAASVDLELPSAIDLAINRRCGKTRWELVVERVFWSAYSRLDFQFANAAVEASPFGATRPKNWKNTTTIRLGMERALNKQWTLLAGLAWDPTPVPDSSLGFELPDSDAWAISIGGRRKVSDSIDWGFAYIYDRKQPRDILAVNNTNGAGLSGRFSGGGAHILNVSMRYRF